MAVNTNQGDAQHAWDLMKTITFAMLATRDGEKIRSRPMAAYIRPDEGLIYFLTDVRRHKDDEIAQDHHVNLGFADASAQKYVSVSGYAAISNDRGKIKELFGTAAKAWWDSPDDPNIRILKVTPEEAEYWDSPGTLVSYVKMAVAAATGTRPDLGDNRKVAI
ncbi:Pyridoxamine 5'-phosphate oxidase-related, FMN-binding [Rhodopseudomonas palustris HaA2]|uniref:Pyridoxamine 5'-phosphate oxidase-related, FMN-binding n=1 Tax=Rhodopseudomonas palustris (strain HaA2) TaxID=316058 RepID=Q2J3C6_RHOP2|nr:pyridoxamine 5'-phosphate oxidase family protein [Rhodopseudomonas palustris]ABD05034.1 Pyridoxamine 5'-phosphate oxidase-related, FMN-binding [Rhodopseudomonas palustris HaA2]